MNRVHSFEPTASALVSGRRKRMLSVEFFLTNQRFFCPAAWNKYGANKKGVEPKRISEMKWKKPHHSKKGMQNNNKCFGLCLALCTNWCDMWIRDNGANRKKQTGNNTKQR